MSINLESRIKGAMIGLACGDYLGMPFEFRSPDVVNYFLDQHTLKPEVAAYGRAKELGYYTDDTSMTLCMAESLLEKGFDTKDQLERYLRWYKEGYLSADGKIAFGIGQNTMNKFITQSVDQIPSEIHDNPREGGNGALMRCVPIGLFYYQNIEDLVDKSIKSAIVTHNNEVAAWSCVIYNTLISYILNGNAKDKLIENLFKEDYFSQVPKELQDMLKTFELKENTEINNSGYSLNTLEIALYSFMKTESYEKAVEMSIRFGGDTDTQAVVVGGLAGAYYGYESIPEEWVKPLMNLEMIQGIVGRVVERIMRVN